MGVASDDIGNGTIYSQRAITIRERFLMNWKKLTIREHFLSRIIPVIRYMLTNFLHSQLFYWSV